MHGEQRYHDDQGQRHDVGFEARIDDRQALDGAEHRHGRGDHGVAEEESGPHDAQRQNEAAALLEQGFDQHHERKNAAFALVVGAHQHDHVFQCDDDEQRPDEQRGDAQHGKAQIAAGTHHRVQRFAHGVKRAGADVAIDHAERREGEFQLACWRRNDRQNRRVPLFGPTPPP